MVKMSNQGEYGGDDMNEKEFNHRNHVYCPICFYAGVRPSYPENPWNASIKILLDPDIIMECDPFYGCGWKGKRQEMISEYKKEIFFEQ